MQKREKLNSMLQQWPAGGLRTAASLRAQGIDLGAGKRELVKGGKLDKEFMLTVPASPYAAEIHF